MIFINCSDLKLKQKGGQKMTSKTDTLIHDVKHIDLIVIKTAGGKIRDRI